MAPFSCAIGKGPAKAIDTFALQRDLMKLDHKVGDGGGGQHGSVRAVFEVAI